MTWNKNARVNRPGRVVYVNSRGNFLMDRRGLTGWPLAGAKKIVVSPYRKVIKMCYAVHATPCRIA